jgi:hypothetical protein
MLLVAVDDTCLHIVATELVLYVVSVTVQEPPDHGHECPL